MHLTKASAPALDCCWGRFEERREERASPSPFSAFPSGPAAADEDGASEEQATAGAQATDSTRGTNTRSG